MKQFWMISPLALFALIMTLSQSKIVQPNGLSSTNEPIIYSDSSIIQYPANIKAIIDAKCYECHSEKGKDDDAKDELMWDDISRLSKMDQVYTMDAIIESIEDNEMPPEDYVKKHPGAALTKEEAKQLIEWADAIASKLME
ncbi:MAG: heme-binding domain-containing protein [Saprospiraceae bacterium]